MRLDVQFSEQRMPTLNEINAFAPDTPVFVLHLYNLEEILWRFFYISESSFRILRRVSVILEYVSQFP